MNGIPNRFKKLKILANLNQIQVSIKVQDVDSAASTSSINYDCILPWRIIAEEYTVGQLTAEWLRVNGLEEWHARDKNEGNKVLLQHFPLFSINLLTKLFLNAILLIQLYPAFQHDDWH